MTREEAAQTIDGLIISAGDEDGPCIFSDQIEALEMAIKAFKEIEKGLPQFSATCVRTDEAFKTWGLDIRQIRRRAK